MSILIVNDEEFEAERKKFENKEDSFVVHEINHGRNENDTNVPQPIRELIVEDALEGATAESLSKIYNVSPSSVSAYKNGATSTASYRQKNSKLIAAKDRVSNRAYNRLNEALKALGTKNLSDEKPKDIASIAKDMATVAEKMSPKVDGAKDGPQVHLHLYAPKMKQITDYEIVEG